MALAFIDSTTSSNSTTIATPATICNGPDHMFPHTLAATTVKLDGDNYLSWLCFFGAQQKIGLLNGAPDMKDFSCFD